MTAQILQEELVKEIGVIFRDDLFKDSAGEYIKMNVYEQNLPIRQDEDAPDPIPYVIVRVETGQAKGGAEPQEVFVTLLIGYFDDDAGNNGHKGVLGIIQKIQERFMKEPMLAKQFYFMNDEQHPFDWALQDEESFPYFFGAASMTFATAAIRIDSHERSKDKSSAGGSQAGSKDGSQDTGNDGVCRPDNSGSGNTQSVLQQRTAGRIENRNGERTCDLQSGRADQQSGGRERRHRITERCRLCIL